MTRIALLGCGNIGNIIARHAEGLDIVAVFDRDPAAAERLAARVGARACATFDELLASDYRVLVEAASVQAVAQYGEAALRRGRDLVVLSVGALADAALRERLTTLARQQGCRLHIPSGAVFGLDNLKVGRLSRLDTLRLRTTKPAAALGGEPVPERRLLFEGTAAECIRHYPRNINVAVALGLAAGREVMVEIWVDPAATRNRHEILAQGEFGEVRIDVQNVPSPDNPRTSYLAALSVLALLRGLGRSAAGGDLRAG